MSHPPVKFRGAFTIRTYEVDQNKRATIPAIIQLMHEAAMQNVIQLKLSVWDLEEQHLSWVLMRKNTVFHRLPDLGETIYIETYPAGFERLITYRDYKVFDAKNKLIAQTSSAWLLMDTQQRKMVRIPEYLYDFELPKLEDCLPRPVFRVPKFKESHFTNHYKVNWFDLDFNGHLSNVNYVKWLVETMEEEGLVKGTLTKLSIAYKQECVWKEQVIAETQKIDKTSFLHRLKRAADGKELALAHSTWMVN